MDKAYLTVPLCAVTASHGTADAMRAASEGVKPPPPAAPNKQPRQSSAVAGELASCL